MLSWDTLLVSTIYVSIVRLLYKKNIFRRNVPQWKAFSECFPKIYPTGGETEEEKIRVDIMENQAMDFRNGFVIMCYTDFVSATLKVNYH